MTCTAVPIASDAGYDRSRPARARRAATSRTPGRRLAGAVASVPDLPRVWAYSPTPLGIEAPGVHEDVIGDEPGVDGDDARHRTSGLRLLTRSGGRLFLLHDGWTPETGTVVLLPDDGTIRWQFSN